MLSRVKFGSQRVRVGRARSPVITSADVPFWKNLGSILETSLTSGSCINKAQGEKKWAAPILDRILQDQSLDHNLVLDQDQDHILERRDTVLGLVPGHIQGLVVEIVFILEIIVEITGIIEE